MSAPRVRREKQWGFRRADGEISWFHFEWRYVGTSNVPDEKTARAWITQKMEDARKSGVLGPDVRLEVVSRTHVRSTWERDLRPESEGWVT